VLPAIFVDLLGQLYDRVLQFPHSRARVDDVGAGFLVAAAALLRLDRITDMILDQARVALPVLA
jgi:hypothetical protein